MSKPLRVLMVEDSEDDVLLTILALNKGGYKPTYESVEDAEAMRKALREKTWDVVLCDYRMPKFNGLAAIALLKETAIDIPLIIVSGAIGEETAVECMRAGAHDYVMKNNLPRLVPAIERELKQAESRRQQKQTEEALWEKERRFQNLYQESPIPTFTWKKKDDDFTLVDFNRAALQITNGKVVDLLGKSALKMYRKNPNILIDMNLCYKEQSVVRREIVSQHFAPGRILSVHYGFIPPDMIIVHTEDLTDRKQAEEKLRESEEKYRGILENMDDMYYEVDLKGSLVFFNEAMILQTGYSREELMGLNYRKYQSPEMRRIMFSVFSEIYKTGRPDGLFEYEIITKGGQTRNYESWVSLLRDKNNEPIGFRGISRDVTARKKVEQQLLRTLESLRNAVGTTIQVMVAAVEARDPYTAGHQLRVADLARTIATEMGLSQEQIEGIRMAGSIHDIGKLSIPAEILSKPAKLTDVEFSLIKEHAQKGYEILKDVESPWSLAEIVYQHHERMDGSGYPRNLKGDEILIEARIMAVADVVEAMASHRPYRPAFGIDAALAEIEKNRGILYDNAVAEACLRLFREKGYKLQQN